MSTFDYAKSISSVFEDLNHDRVENAVMTCLRLARNLGDFVNSAVFLRETGVTKEGVIRALYDDMRHLKKEGMEYVLRRSVDHWLETHTLDFSFGQDENGDELTVLAKPVAEIEADLRQWQKALDDLKIPVGMSPYDTAAFTDSNQRRADEIRLRISALVTIRNRVKMRCLNYAIRLERQLQAQQKPQAFLLHVQNDVNNYFKARSEDAYNKLERAAQLFDSSNPEDQSLLLTQVRRAIQATADYFYPPTAGNIVCSDGQTRDLSKDRYLNRLQEFLAAKFSKSTSADLLRAEFETLSVFARRLNELASKGVHSDVSSGEAKQGLVGLYMFLFNVIRKLQENADGNVDPAPS